MNLLPKMIYDSEQNKTKLRLMIKLPNTKEIGKKQKT